MITVPGYKIEKKIYQSQHTLVYRGHRESDGQAVVLKTHRMAYPDFATLARFKQDYELGCKIEDERVINYYNLIEDNHKLILVLEDFGAVSLREVIPVQGFEPTTFLEIAFQLADALAAIHKYQVIHKDLKPGNIVVVPATSSEGEINQTSTKVEKKQWLLKTLGSLRQIKRASEAQLTQVPGIGPELAREIRRHFHQDTSTTS